jgi:hypothetical protein
MLLEHKSINARVAILELRTTNIMLFLKPWGACFKNTSFRNGMCTNELLLFTVETRRNTTLRPYDLYLKVPGYREAAFFYYEL